MRKFIAITVALLFASSFAYATVAVNDIDGYVGEATNIYIEGQDADFDGSQVTVLANGHKEGATANVSGESNLTDAALAYGVILIADTGALDASSCRYIALADGTPGQMVTISLVAATAGTLYITDDKVNDAVFGDTTATGWDDIAFNAALDSVTLLFVDTTYGWVIIGSNSVTVT
jgi:hypothetical protein